MLKLYAAIFLLYLASSVHCSPAAEQPKSLFSILNKLTGYDSCVRPCPPWKCQDDSTVIHGYCCKCPGWEFDNAPVPCYPDLKCPISPELLCSDYNFMMECCCTGLNLAN